MDTCIYCVEKHLGKARVYVTEARAGYRGRYGMALGELAAAEEEADGFPLLQAKIRDTRKTLERDRDEAVVDWEVLLGTTEDLVRKADPAQRKMPDGMKQPGARILPDAPPPGGRRHAQPKARLDAPEPGCKSCAEKEQAARKAADLRDRRLAQEARKRERLADEVPKGADLSVKPQPKPLLAILTTLADFAPSYSLVPVILDQARAAAMAGYRVQVVGMATMSQKRPSIPGVEFVPLIPDVGWVENEVDDFKVGRLHVAIEGYLRRVGDAVIITHDMVFQAWYTCLAKAIHIIANTCDVWPDTYGGYNQRWYHQIHSSVGPRPPEALAQWRASVPKGHKMVAVNWADISRLAAYYQAPSSAFTTIPNVRDPRTFLGLSEDATIIMDRVKPHLVDVSQVYPLSTPRAESKGLDIVIKTFGRLKKDGKTVRLIVANAHHLGEGPKAIKAKMDALAREEGLTPEEFCWTSDLLKDAGTSGGSNAGVSTETVRGLFQITNVFLFPSISESCGLVMLEAALGGVALILNDDLPVLKDYIPQQGASWVPWGSILRSQPPETLNAAIEASVPTILAEIESPKRAARAGILRDFGLDTLAEVLVRL